MGDENIKKRQAYAKEAARRELERAGFQVIKSDNSPVCLIGCIPGVYEKKIMIRMEQITVQDRAALVHLRILPNQTKAIWCKVSGSSGWKIVELDHENRPIL
jgi:hypothetical protein